MYNVHSTCMASIANMCSMHCIYADSTIAWAQAYSWPLFPPSSRQRIGLGRTVEDPPLCPVTWCMVIGQDEICCEKCSLQCCSVVCYNVAFASEEEVFASGEEGLPHPVCGLRTYFLQTDIPFFPYIPRLHLFIFHFPSHRWGLLPICTFFTRLSSHLRFQNWFLDEVSRWFCMALHGEAQKTCFWDQKTLKLSKNPMKIKTYVKEIPL